MLRLFDSFPAVLQDGILSDRSFRRSAGLRTTATVALGEGDLAFARNEFFDALRTVLGNPQESREITAKDNSQWQLSFQATDNGRHFFLSRKNRQHILADFSFLSPDRESRMTAFEEAVRNLNARGPEIEAWRSALNEGGLENEDIEAFQKELDLCPVRVSAEIASGIAQGKTSTSIFVPVEARYYERLIGVLEYEHSLPDYLAGGAREHIDELLSWNQPLGLKFALLMASHPHVQQQIDLSSCPTENLEVFFAGLAESGDRISQVGGFELGIRLLPNCPGLAGSLTSIAKQVRDDEPHAEQGRMQLLSSLVAFVDGTIARAGILKSQPPFWRRMAAIAQASLIEQSIVEGGVDLSIADEFSNLGRGPYFYEQTLIDLRREPRWLPDFIAPEQLHNELVGRVVGAVEANLESVGPSELRELVVGEAPDSLKSRMAVPFAFFPGPLEGACAVYRAPPSEIEELIRKNLESADGDFRSFTALANFTPLFSIGEGSIALAAKTIREAQYLIRAGEGDGEAFAMLWGLATAASAARSGELAREVRVLARVVRRRSRAILLPVNELRILMITAAAFAELNDWSTFVGEWATELAFEDMAHDDAKTLASHLGVLLDLEPHLWQTCGRAQAALDSFS